MAGGKSLVCRQIEEQDLDAIVTLLTQGFKEQRNREFWIQALARLARHDTPPGLPRFGYILQAEGSIVGVILLIFTLLRTGSVPFVRCNLSSWYVEEPFRLYAPLLISRALRHGEATYFNLTAVPHTFPILHAQGFHRYCEGRFLAIPALSRGPAGATVEAFAAGSDRDGLSDAEVKILETHAEYGCVSVVCRHAGQAVPLVFAPRRKLGIGGMALLAYCRDVADFVRFAGPVGRFLFQRGLFAVAVDSDGPIDGLIGRFAANKPKFFRGPERPRPGDMVYSERTMFGS